MINNTCININRLQCLRINSSNATQDGGIILINDVNLCYAKLIVAVSRANSLQSMIAYRIDESHWRCETYSSSEVSNVIVEEHTYITDHGLVIDWPISPDLSVPDGTIWYYYLWK